MLRNKPNDDIWEHFQKLERKESSNYYYARCKFCDEDASSPVEGRIRTMQNHLKVCKPFLDYKAQEQAVEGVEDSISSTSNGTFSTVCSNAERSSVSLVTSSTLKKKTKMCSIKGFMDRAFTPNEEAVLNQRIIEMITDNAMSFLYGVA